MKKTFCILMLALAALALNACQEQGLPAKPFNPHRVVN